MKISRNRPTFNKNKETSRNRGRFFFGRGELRCIKQKDNNVYYFSLAIKFIISLSIADDSCIEAIHFYYCILDLLKIHFNAIPLLRPRYSIFLPLIN